MGVTLIVVQIVASIALIGLILMQQGKGADAGASFGAGASQTFFGSAGSASAVTKLTALFATIFFLASLGLAYAARQESQIDLKSSLSEQLQLEKAQNANELPVPGSDDAAEQAPNDASLAPKSTKASEDLDLEANSNETTTPAASKPNEAAVKTESIKLDQKKTSDSQLQAKPKAAADELPVE